MSLYYLYSIKYAVVNGNEAIIDNGVYITNRFLSLYMEQSTGILAKIMGLLVFKNSECFIKGKIQ